MRKHCPDVVILDADSDAADDDTICRQIGEQTRQGQASVVLLGVAQRRSGPAAHDHVVAKPYHYAPLIRKIEQLLERPREAPRQANS
jgi:DNA-binding response OmpR family regulator